MKNFKNGCPKDLDRYAGVIVNASKELTNNKKYYRWLKRVKKAGVKMLLLGNNSMPKFKYLKDLGIELSLNKDKSYSNYEIITKDEMLDYEIETVIQDREFFYNPKDSKALLVAQNSKGEKSTISAITPWGGYAMDGSFFTEIREKIFLHN